MNTNAQLMNKPIPLIQFEGEKFKITNQAIQFLKNLSGPIGVITIVGKYRTGKSLFLNKVLLNNNQSFKVCPTINSCTKGLWISRQIIKSQYHQVPQMDVIVIDSEGFGAMEETDAYNNKILLFALLLSSYFIYNSVGSIDEKSLNNLNVITNLAKQLQAKNLGNQKIQEQFPTFMWIVRDFTLRLVNTNGQQMQPKQYLQYALQIQKGLSDAVQNKNKIRRMIKHFFRQRDCFTLVTPVQNQNDLQNLNSLPDSSLRPQFLQQIHTLRQKILKRIKPKKIKSRRLTGQTFIQLANTYIQAINNGTLPNIESAYKSIYNFQLSKTISSAKQLISSKSNQFLKTIQKDSTFLQLQKQLLDESLTYLKKKISNQTDLQMHYNNMKQFIQSTIIASKAKNKKKSLAILIENFNEKMQQLGYSSSVEQIDMKWNKLQKYYRQQFKQNPSLAEFLLQNFYPLKFQIYTSIIKRQSQSIKSQQSQKSILKQTLQHKIKQQQQTRRQLQNNLYQSQRQLSLIQIKSQQQHKIKTLQIHYRQKQLIQLRQDVRKMENKIQYLQKQLKQKQSQITQLKIRSSSLNMELKESDDDRGFVKKQLDILRDKLNYRNKQIQQLKIMNQQLRSDIDKLQDKQNNYTNRFEIQLQNKSQQYQHLQTKYENSQKQLHNIIIKNTKLENILDSQSKRILKEQKLYETMLQTLKQNYQDQRKHAAQLTQANKNMAFALKHLEQRFQHAQEKQKRLKQFKRCFKNSSCMQCQNCSKFFVPTIFPQHLNVCILGPENLKKIQNQKINNFHPALQIIVKQTLLKDSDSKPYTQYILEVRKGSKMWSINRKYKQFCDLHLQLKTQLPGIHLSDFSYIVNPQQSTKRSLLVEQRKKILQKYLYDLSNNLHVAQQIIWRQFIQDQDQNVNYLPQQNQQKLAITQLLKSTQKLHHQHHSPQKQNNFDSNRVGHKTPQQFLRIWNQRNLRAKQISKTKKTKN